MLWRMLLHSGQIMARDWEASFSHWAKPPSETERDRIENAVRGVRAALDADDDLRPVTLVYVQGSYRNRVNVRAESDVDIGILYTGNSFGDVYPPGKTRGDFGNVDAIYTYGHFKNAVEAALVAHFGRRAVHRGNKAFDIHENTYRVDADVVPTFIHRRYQDDGSFICGTHLYPDAGGELVNWPERLFDDEYWPRQHYENGVAKNAATGRRYKGLVRILKGLRNEMESVGIAAAKPIPGFLVECLVWNVPAYSLDQPTWGESVQSALAFLWGQTRSAATCAEWGEVSELKYLFRGSLPSKREQAHAFIDSAWSYVGVRTS